MEDLVEQYLFQNKQCPLPLIGSLQMRENSAVTWHGDNKLSAPFPTIELTNEMIPADPFTRFIADQKGISLVEAAISLQQYCAELQKLNAYKEMKLENAGRFQINQYGALVFKQEPAPKEFLPTIRIQRVLHSNPASHNILVGDNDTNSEVMTEFYSDKGKSKKELWWIGALILTVVAAAVLFFYFKDHKTGENFGNTKPITTSPAPETYKPG